MGRQEQPAVPAGKSIQVPTKRLHARVEGFERAVLVLVALTPENQRSGLAQREQPKPLCDEGALAHAALGFHKQEAQALGASSLVGGTDLRELALAALEE